MRWRLLQNALYFLFVVDYGRVGYVMGFRTATYSFSFYLVYYLYSFIRKNTTPLIWLPNFVFSPSPINVDSALFLIMSLRSYFNKFSVNYVLRGKLHFNNIRYSIFC